MILELQKIIKEEYGREVSLAEAFEIGNGMVVIYKIYNVKISFV